MAKSTKHAGLICFILTIITIAGVALGIWKKEPLALIIGVLPAVIYEVYRTEGFHTRLASWGILGLSVAEIVLIVKGINLDLVTYLPFLGFLGTGFDIKLAEPVIIAVLAVILLKQTAGIYTKWLAVVIAGFAVALFVLLAPGMLGKALEAGKNPENVEKVERTIKP